VAHYAAIAQAAPDLPLIAYNVPGRTGVNLLPATLERIWQNPAVVAIKESSGNLVQIGEIARTLPLGKLLLAGDDNLALPALALGASGLVSVIANLLPQKTKALVEAARMGDLHRAQALHRRLRPLMDALFLESSPIPLKAALEIMGLATQAVRLPLLPASAETQVKLRDALDRASEKAGEAGA
jgi:4-hydroxy-tetrahydrodipicolinate synthase